eukprot:Hpha_TRINITY_DN12433_c0_g1::TRINITY_DN12433_c0_g1_i1::g.42669::m.42669
MGCGASTIGGHLTPQIRRRPQLVQTVLVHSRRVSSGKTSGDPPTHSPHVSVGRRTSQGEEMPEPSETSQKWRVRRMVFRAKLNTFFSSNDEEPLHPVPPKCSANTDARVRAWLRQVEKAREDKRQGSMGVGSLGGRAMQIEVLEYREQQWTLTPLSTPKSMATHTSYGDDDELLAAPSIPCSPDNDPTGGSSGQPPRRLRDARQVTRLQYILRERELRIERRRYGRPSQNGDEDIVGPLVSPENSPRHSTNNHNPLSPPELPLPISVSGLGIAAELSHRFEVVDTKALPSPSSLHALSMRTNQTTSSRSGSEEGEVRHTQERGTSRGQGLILIPHPPSQIYDRPSTGDSGRSSGSTPRQRMMDVRLPSGGCLVMLPRVSDATTNSTPSNIRQDSDSVIWLDSGSPYRSDHGSRGSLNSRTSRASKQSRTVHATISGATQVPAGRKSIHSF